MKKIALALSAFALLAFSGVARAEGDDAAKTETSKTTTKGNKKTTKKTSTDTAADGTGSTKTETKTEKTAK